MTLYDKLFSEIEQRTYSHADDIGVRGIEKAAKACERVVIQAKVDLLGSQNEKLGRQKKELKDSLDKEPIRDSRVYYSGKIEGIKLAIENNRQEIQELEKQLL